MAGLCVYLYTGEEVFLPVSTRTLVSSTEAGWFVLLLEVSGLRVAVCVSAESIVPVQECPSGIVNEENFKQIYSQFFPQGGEEMVDIQG